MLKESYLYKKLSDNKVQCRTCAHYCVIAPGKRGICGVRENQNGKLYSLVYGKPCAVNIDPIEKKPFYHFLPGTKSLSIATVGCNFFCHSCQNWFISQSPKNGRELFSAKIGREQFSSNSPAEIVEIALKNKLPSISYTYTEPTIFLEYALDTMKLAKKAGLKNIWVTNGFLSKETFELVAQYLDAANVDLKSFSDDFYQKYCGGRLQPVLDTLKRMKTLRRSSGQEKTRAQNNYALGRAHKICAPIWVEITTLVIPTLNDSEKIFRDIAKFIKEELGSETPWHISRFFGDFSWKLQHIQNTPIKTLKKAEQIGRQYGLKNIHLGNI